MEKNNTEKVNRKVRNKEMKRTMKKLVLVVMAVAMLAAFLGGCGGSASADGVVNDFLTAVKSGNLEKAAQYVMGNEGADLSQITEAYNDKMIKAMFAKYSFEKPKLVSEDGDKAQVKAKITSVDFGKVMEKVFAAAMDAAFSGDSEMTEDQMTEMFIESMTSADADLVEREITFNLVKDGGSYKIQPDDNLIEAIMAGSTQLDY
jgi:hypothetical protein